MGRLMDTGDFISVHRSAAIYFTAFSAIKTVCSYSSAHHINNFETMHYQKLVIVSCKGYLLN